MSDQGGPIRNALLIAAGMSCWALASLDDVIGIGTRRHIRRFLRWPIDGVPIADLLRSRAMIDGWVASHRECAHESHIECVDQSIGLCRWDVSSYPPVPWLGRQSWYITPINRNAASLLPELIPAGMRLPQFPTGTHYAASFIHCQASPEQARVWLQPLIQRLEPLANDSIDPGGYPAAR